MQKRSNKLNEQLMNNTVLKIWFQPMTNALEKVRYSDNIFKALPMPAFNLFGCLRQLRSICSLREAAKTITDELPIISTGHRYQVGEVIHQRLFG